MSWLLRDPREIPEALVASLKSYCARAERPASSEEVRLALARLSAARDREILQAAAREPPARPLSPHAFVDILEGMPAEQAAALEEAGAYLAIAREVAAEALEMQLREARERPAERRTTTTPRRRRRPQESPVTPFVRRRARPASEEEPSAEGEQADEAPPPPSPPPRPGRKPAEPRFGRFVSGPPAKRSIAELEGDEGAAILRELIEETHGNLGALVERLNVAWAPPHGRIGPERAEKLLDRHGLVPVRKAAERARLRALLRRNRGFARPVARAWGIPPGELRDLVRAHGLEEEVRELRARARAEALAETRLPARLQLLYRHVDRLRDLGVLRPLNQETYHALRRLVDAFPFEEEAPATPEELLERIRRAEGIDRALWTWAAEHFNLLGMAAHRLGVRLAPRPRRFDDRGRRTPPGSRPRGPRRDR